MTTRSQTHNYGETRRPTFPLDRQPGSLFLGWGPKI